MPTVQNNCLLSALPADVQNCLVEDLKLVVLPKGMILCEPGDAMPDVFFPVDCIVSLQNLLEDGASTEVSIVGNEGMVGIALFMGGDSSQSRAIVESPGYAYRLSGEKLKKEFDKHSDMMILMLRYTQSLITQVSQTAVCNRHHSVQQQVCRWLLRSSDCLPDNHLAMTQELIANVLGVRREGVTDVAGKLQKRGVIEYSRGHIKILDRANLERLSCECYALVKKETNRLLPPIDFVPTRLNDRTGRGSPLRAITSALRPSDSSLHAAAA